MDQTCSHRTGLLRHDTGSFDVDRLVHLEAAAAQLHVAGGMHHTTHIPACRAHRLRIANISEDNIDRQTGQGSRVRAFPDQHADRVPLAQEQPNHVVSHETGRSRHEKPIAHSERLHVELFAGQAPQSGRSAEARPRSQVLLRTA